MGLGGYYFFWDGLFYAPYFRKAERTIDMKAAILSCGKNRRLAALGKPKGMLVVGERTLFERTFCALERAGFKEVFCVIRKDAASLEAYLKKLRYGFKLTLVKKNSRNPFYSMMALKSHVREGGVLIFNVDAFFHDDDLAAFCGKVRSGTYLTKDMADKAMVMWAMKAFDGMDDPAYMKLHQDGRVLAYGKNISPSPYVFAQVRYCGARIFREVRRDYPPRMETFIKHLIRKGCQVYAHPTRFPVYDIDTPSDYNKVKQLSSYDIA